MEFHLKITGVILILLAFVHIIFPKYFNWKNDLKSVSLINKEMVYVHTFFIAATVLLMGILCICCTADLINTRLGKQISFGLFIFWGLRLACQIFIYSASHWKTKIFETVIHILFLLLWAYFALVFYIIFSR
jgi:hypothetical protein